MQHSVAFTLTDMPVAFTLTGHNQIYPLNPLALLPFFWLIYPLFYMKIPVKDGLKPVSYILDRDFHIKYSLPCQRKFLSTW